MKIENLLEYMLIIIKISLCYCYIVNKMYIFDKIDVVYVLLDNNYR